MIKKITTLLLMLGLTFSVFACDKKAETDTIYTINGFSDENWLYQMIPEDDFGILSINRDTDYVLTGKTSAKLEVNMNGDNQPRLKQRLQSYRYGYDFKVEKGAFGARNIVIGDPEAAKVLYTAHYDTCARMPFPNFITPKCLPIYLLYQILLTVVLLELNLL